MTELQFREWALDLLSCMASAWERDDEEALFGLFSPDVAIVDHRALGAPSGRGWGSLQHRWALRDLLPRLDQRLIEEHSPFLLLSMGTYGDLEGNELRIAYVAQIEEGVIAEFVAYDPESLDEARAELTRRIAGMA